MNRPRIAIPEIGQNVSNYTKALYEAGMEPVVISVQSEQNLTGYQQEYLDYAGFKVEAYDGLLLPGGVDINPARYGQEDKACCGVWDKLDELQLAVLDEFVKKKKPVLGVCRGAQLLNVYFGGSLIQDLPTAFRHSRSLEEPDRQHGCEALRGSWLEVLYGQSFSINSSHHQAVDRVGNGVQIDSRCTEDGTPESIHHASLPIYGVQWHPERMCLEHEREDTVNGLPVFQFFCSVCKEQMDEGAKGGALAGEVLMHERMGL